MSTPCKDANRKPKLILSRDTTLEYVILFGASVVWPPATNLVFLLEAHAYVKYDMKFYILMYNQLLNWSRSCLVWGDPVDRRHKICSLLVFLLEPFPSNIPRFIVKPQFLLRSIGQTDPIIVFRPSILGLYFGYDPILPSQ